MTSTNANAPRWMVGARAKLFDYGDLKMYARNTTRATSTNRADTTRTAPEMRGQLIATVSRGDATELRITRDEYNGYPFASLRIWNKIADAWFPDAKRGVSVRPRELTAVIEALQNAAAQLGDADGAR